MGLKVAVIGLSRSSRHLAPWGNPEWELWGLAWDFERRHDMTRTFEMHDECLVREYEVQPGYVESLKDLPGLVTPDGWVGSSYPFDEVAKTIGGDYFCSSMAYMVAKAIHDGAEEIALYGIDMTDAEYVYQRANMEYLIGLARGKGIKVNIPDSSPLCKYVDSPGFAYDGRYGKAL